MDKFLVAENHIDSGLSNRLKCLISVIRFAKDSSREVILHWPISFTCGTKFYELFKKTSNFEIIDTPELDSMKKTKKFFICENYRDISKNCEIPYLAFNTWRFLLFPQEVEDGFAKVFPEGSGQQIDLEYERIPKNVLSDFSKKISDYLVPLDEIQNQVKAFSKKYDLPNTIGLHVRRTEFLLNADGRGKVSSDQRFFDEMRKELKKNPNLKFFLATDSKETQNNFLNEFPGKILFLEEKDWDKSTKKSTQDALIDLLLLANTKLILGSYLSTFTEMAWWFGGCKQEVRIMGSKEDKTKVLSNYENRKKINPLYKKLRESLKSLRRKSPLFRKILDYFMNKKSKLMKD